ncbi:MAG: hypothetical protein HN368_04105 [Spirochaetales bacterium]|nr:hypothetical protein [Spirochaetales bacterium]
MLTDAAHTSIQENWFRGAWYDGLAVYWHDLCEPGYFSNRTFSEKGKPVPGKNDTGIVASHFTLEAGDEETVRYVISWSFPQASNYWKPVESSGTCCDGDSCCSDETSWKNYYATLFETSIDSAVYALEHWNRLKEDTFLFRDSLFSSTLPEEVLDAVSANISILKSPTVMRLEDGSFYGFEGCHPGSGCCEGSCTHVWNYAYALPFLFPRLERSMRDTDYGYNMAPDGGMGFRLQLPLGREPWDFRPCVDGQFGGVMKMYRDWKISGDTEWLKNHWEKIKLNLSFAWADSNPDRWDADRDGVLEGRQHHTLDMELFGPNPWLTGFYLGALSAGAEMADHLEDGEAADLYRELFSKGYGYVNEKLFNGEFYVQKVNLSDRTILEAFESPDEIGILQGNKSVLDSYWGEEHKEIKYQFGEGCAADQMLAQWHANLSGLSRIFEAGKARTALESIYRYNYLTDMSDHFNPCRHYVIQKEAGVLICSFPGTAPVIAAPYSEEAWPGIEYAVGSLMIQESLVKEGLEIVASVRSRFDGHRRNPWNEFECGSNYARSMSSYALLPALSGFTYDMTRAEIGFDPVETEAWKADTGEFRCFWSLGPAWGVFEQTAKGGKISVLSGELPVRRIRVPQIVENGITSVHIDSERVDFKMSENKVELAEQCTVPENGLIELRCS